MSAAERFSPPRANNCNVELVGQDAGEGLSWGGAVYDVCAYLGKSAGPISGKDGPSPKRAGTLVEDVSDSRHPTTVAYLDRPAMLEPNESIATNAPRKLLAAIAPYYMYDDERTANRSDSDLDVYDVSNCRRPALKGSLKLSHLRSHGGYFAPDGRTFYVTSFTGNIPVTDKTPANDKWRHSNTDALVGIDVSDPAHPQEILRWVLRPEMGAAHQLSISQDGNRAYLSLFGRQNGTDGPDAVGIAVVDISAVQARKPNPQANLISRLLWQDGGNLQGNLEVRVKGQSYLLASTPGSGGGAFGAAGGGVTGGCNPNSTTSGYVAVLDSRDGRNLKLSSRLILESSLPSNCGKVRNDPAAVGGGPGFCAVDDLNDARIVACGFGNAGMRVFDIRNPLQPREIAYYKPAPTPEGVPPRPGSFYNLRWARERHVPGGGVRADHTPRVLAVRRAQGEIWFMSHENGFQVVRFTDSFRKAEPGLF
jgi:hypothetical protein